MKECRRAFTALRRATAIALGAVLASLCVASALHAQPNAWRPEKPVELVVPTTPGGAIDTTARLMQKVAQNGKLVPTPMVILNKPGGGRTRSP